MGFLVHHTVRCKSFPQQRRSPCAVANIFPSQLLCYKCQHKSLWLLSQYTPLPQVTIPQTVVCIQRQCKHHHQAFGIGAVVCILKHYLCRAALRQGPVWVLAPNGVVVFCVVPGRRLALDRFGEETMAGVWGHGLPPATAKQPTSCIGPHPGVRSQPPQKD